MSESIPKVFISYSWTNLGRVIDLAQRLMGDGVDVVLDQWELKEGQDKYAFMERSVTDMSIKKVLMVCDKTYAEKANDRKGGVGDETMVISPEVYEKVTETKYIPIIFERDENGKEYTPAYLKSRIYIDLCADNPNYEREYEKLLRNLHDKPEYSKPALGKMPEWLNAESVDLSGVRNLLKQMQAYDGKNKSKIEFYMRKFNDEFIKALLSFAPENNDELEIKLFTQIDSVRPLRDLYFDYVEALIMSDTDTGTVAGDFFEKLYNETYFVDKGNSFYYSEFEFSQFLIWEMFIGTVAILLHYENYAELNSMLHRTYFLRENPLSEKMSQTMYTQFKPAFQYIEDIIKPKSESPRLYTLAGDIAIKREKLPIIKKSTLVNADLVLYQLSYIYQLPDERFPCYWFPSLYIYHNAHQSLWSKMVSVKHCQKLFSLFDVENLKQLKEIISKNKPDRQMRYSSGFDSAASILHSIELVKIGTMP